MVVSLLQAKDTPTSLSIQGLPPTFPSPSTWGEHILLADKEGHVPVLDDHCVMSFYW